MIARWASTQKSIKFEIEAEPDDFLGYYQNIAGPRKHKLSSNKVSFFVEKPKELKVKNIHPDLFALSLIILLDTFVGNRLLLDEGVSSEMQSYYKRLTGKKIEPVNKNLIRRASEDDFRPAISYSGGSDSVAGLALMPENTLSVFLERYQRSEENYIKSAAKQSCDLLRRMGRDVLEVKSDLEYIITPHTFPHPLSTGIPILLFADYYKIDSIAYGNTLDAVYNLSKHKYKKSENSPYTYYDEIFKYANIQLMHITAGFSEVANAQLNIRSPYGHLAQSCMYGRGLGDTCMNCRKCFKRTSYKLIGENSNFPDSFIDKTVVNREVESALRHSPMRMQNTYQYIAKNAKSKHPIIKYLKFKVGAYSAKVDWMEKWYPCSGNLLPEKYRVEIQKKIQNYTSVMTRKEIKYVEKWNINKYKYSPSRWFWHWRFWKTYSRLYDKHILVASSGALSVGIGKSQIDELIQIYKKKYFIKHNVTSEIKWGSNDGAVAYVKEGLLVAKKAEKTHLYAKYGDSRIEIELSIFE